jgi:hypothetical protein
MLEPPNLYRTNQKLIVVAPYILGYEFTLQDQFKIHPRIADIQLDATAIICQMAKAPDNSADS